MRRWRTGTLAVDNSGELPTAHPFDHKLHRLLLPLKFQIPKCKLKPTRTSAGPVQVHCGQLR